MMFETMTRSGRGMCGISEMQGLTSCLSSYGTGSWAVAAADRIVRAIGWHFKCSSSRSVTYSGQQRAAAEKSWQGKTVHGLSLDTRQVNNPRGGSIIGLVYERGGLTTPYEGGKE